MRAWANNIPLGSLDQLQRATTTGPSHLSHVPTDNPATIPLPVSRESSLRKPASEDFSRAKGSEHSAQSVRKQLYQPDRAEALGVPLPESSGLGDDRCSSVKASNVDSLDQLQAACIPGAVHSALDAAPKQPQQPGTTGARDVPLPESNGPDNDTCSHGAISTVDSLLQLQTAGISVENGKSTSGLAGEHHSDNARPPTQRTDTPVESEQSTSSSAGRTYWENIRPLTQILPHLRAIQPPNGRHERMGRLKAIDYSTDGTASQVRRWRLGPRSDPQKIATRLQDLKGVDDDAIASRMIIVEDLSPELIAILGSVFELDPEFFAEHLNRSGYNNADYGDPPPTRWNTAHMRKNYVSMTWRRPVYQSAEVANLLQTPGAILEKRKEASRDDSPAVKDAGIWRDAEFEISGKRNMHAMEHNSLVDTNIFRQSWPLSTGSVTQAVFEDEEDEERSDTTSQNKPNQKEDLPMAALEERVSYCQYEGDARIPIGEYSAWL